MAKKHAMLRTCRKAYRNACYAGLTSLPGSSKRGMKREALETRLTQATLGLVDILRVIISIFSYGVSVVIAVRCLTGSYKINYFILNASW